jgi:hypothetical protein
MLSFLDKIPFGTPRLRRAGFWLATAFITYTLIGFLVVPPMVRDIAITQLSENLKRPVQIERVSFNPLELRLEIFGIKINKLQGDGELLALDSLDISPGISSIWEFAPVISYLRLNNLKLDITFFGDGKYSISDLLGSPKEPETDPRDKENNEPLFPFALYGFEMTNSTIVFDDRPHNKKHVVSDIFLRVPFMSSFVNLRNEFTQPQFSAVVNGDPVGLKGRTLPFHKTLLTEFQLGAVAIDLDQYWSYLPIETSLKLAKGQFTSNISLFFERPDAQRLNLFLEGGGKLTNLELTSPNEGPVLSFKELSFEMEKFSVGDKDLVLKNVRMDTPFFKLIRHKNNSINWARYFPGSELAEAGPKVKTVGQDKADFLLDIRQFEVQSGSLEWIDQAVPGGFKRTFPQFSFKGTEISTRGERPSAFEATIGKKSVMTIKGVGTMKPIGAKATITAKGFSFSEFEPYLSQLQPLIVDSGVAGLSVGVNFKIHDSHLELDVHDGILNIENLQMRKPNAKKPSLGFATLNATGGVMNLNKKTIAIAEVKISEPTVTVVKEKDGRIDLERLFSNDPEIAAPLKPTPVPVQHAGEKQWEALIASVRVDHGTVGYRNISLKHPTHLVFDKLKIDLDNISTQMESPMTYALSATGGGRSQLAIKGQASLAPLTANGHVDISNISLKPFNVLLSEFAELQVTSGAASANLKYDFKKGSGSQITITGSTELNKVNLKDNFGNGEFAGIDRFKLAGIRFTDKPYRLSIDEIDLSGPKVSINYDEKGHSNFRRAFRIPEPPPLPKEVKGQPEKEKTKSVQPVQVAKHEQEDPFFKTLEIGRVFMDNGHIRFRDASVTPVYFTEITGMNLGLIGLARKLDAKSAIKFKANVGPTPMSITGILNPVVTPIYSDLTIAVNGLDLVPISPYTVEYLGYPVEKGRLYADVKFKTEDWILNADNKFFIEQLVLGPKDKRPDAPNVPVKFGLTLLQDDNGDVELSLPIRGRLDDPDFRIGGIVFKTFASLMFKTLASPFSLIGSIFSNSDKDMDFVVFEPGRHKIDASGLQKIETVTKALNKRKRLQLEVDGVIDAEADRIGLTEVIFENKIKQQKYNSLTQKERAKTSVEAMVIAPGEYEKYLFEAYKDEPDEKGIKPTTLFSTDRQSIKFMERFILDHIKITDEELNALARRRAASVKDHIIKQEPGLTDRVSLIDRPKAKKGKTGVPKHRADFGIK